MNKQEYIIKQFAKTNKKNFENYVISRIWHGINRTDVKIKTQQLVYRRENYALTDLYLPQIGIHVEIDEPFHSKQIVQDVSREAEIIEATNHRVLRIKIKDDIDLLNEQINETIELISNEIQILMSENKFEPWDPTAEFDPNFYKRKGYLDIKENPSFLKSVDACNCLGQNYVNVQRGWFKSKVYPNHHIWFPKFYENEEWDNSISKDGTTIIEICKNKSVAEKWFNKKIENTGLRICFPRTIDNLGQKFYRFVGVFQTDFEASSIENGAIHRRVATRFNL